MSTTNPEPAPTYLQIRDRLISLNPANLGLSPSAEAPHVWGVVMEMGFEVGTATLMTLADGTTSLHYSTGGGLLGRGDYAPIAEPAKKLVTLAESFLQHMTRTEEFPLPEAGQVRFTLRTYSGNYASSASQRSLAVNDHPLSPLYQAAQETLVQIRLLADKKRK